MLTHRRMKAIPCELHIYWNDGVTIECRKFPSILSAKRYVKNEGIKNYSIERLLYENVDKSFDGRDINLISLYLMDGIT